MSNRKVVKDLSDNIIAGAILASFPLNKLDRIIEYASASTVTVKGSNLIPLRIGDHWYLIDSDTTVSTATDMDTGAIAAGTDYYVYACESAGSIVFKISLNSSYPSGFAAATSRKLGGFHTLCAAIGTISGHPLTGASANDILSASVWDLKHRPRSEPEGMVWSAKAGIWVDIYLASGTEASTVSANGGTISDTRNWMDFVDDFGTVKKQLLSDTEFQIIAAGSREEVQIWTRLDPVTAGGHSAYFLLTLDSGPAPADFAADAILTGGTSGYTCTVVTKVTSTTYVCKNISNGTGFTDGEVISDGTNSRDCGAGYPTWAADSKGRIVSDIGCEDCCGVLYQWLRTPSARLDNGTAGGWHVLAGDKGSFYTYGNNRYGNTQLRAGGHWYSAVYCGSRCRASASYRWSTYSDCGDRGRSEPQ